MSDPIRARLDYLYDRGPIAPATDTHNGGGDYESWERHIDALRAVLDLCDRWVMDFCDDHDCRAFREARRVIAEHLGVTE